jgi:hypothetical protein
MSLPGIGITVMLAAIVILWIVLPLLRRTEDTTTAAGDALSHQRERLTLYYSRVLRNIHDLDEDYGTGKLDEAEYHQEREAWTQRGVAALQALDNLAQANPQPLIAEQEAPIGEDAPDAVLPELVTASGPLDDAALDASIEAAIEAAVRKQRAQL